jgi:hypothetical protein
VNRFIVNKRKLDDDNESSVAGTSSGSISHSTVSVSSKTVARQYNEDYLSLGFISSGEEQPRTARKCVVCGEKVANQAMVPSELKSTFTQSTHTYARNQFNMLKGLQLITHARLNNGPKSQLFLKKFKEPTRCKIVNIMFGEEYEKEILKIPVR